MGEKRISSLLYFSSPSAPTKGPEWEREKLKLIFLKNNVMVEIAGTQD
jgi:hypothetical protein